MRPRPCAAGLVVALAVVLAAYALVFGGAFWNRSGERSSELGLTERELPMPVSVDDREGSMVVLDLALTHEVPFWERQLRDFEPGHRHPVLPWLDRAKLGELGFDMSRDPADPEAMVRYERMVPRRVWAALEYDGPAWTAWLAEKERDAATSEVDRKIFELAPTLRSRLCAVDAASDVETLARKYPDRRRIAIVRAFVGSSVERDAGQAPRVVGMLFLENPVVYLPPDARRAIAPFVTTMTTDEFIEKRRNGTLPPPTPRDPRYAFTVAFGRRHEPWIRGQVSK